MQIEEDRDRQAGDAVHGDIRQRLVPAEFIIDQAAQAHGARDQVTSEGGGGVGPQQHQLARAEIGAVQHRLGHVVADRGGIGEGAQLRRHFLQLRRDGLRIEAGGAEDARTDAKLDFGAKKLIERRIDRVVQILGRGGLGNADHHRDGVGLVGDRGEGRRERPGAARLGDGGAHVGNQHQLALGEGGVECVLGRACDGAGGGDKADDGKAGRDDGAGTGDGFVELDSMHGAIPMQSGGWRGG